MPRKTRAAVVHLHLDVAASMRPRPDAAENSSGCAVGLSRCQSFNEAAARCRGKHALARCNGRDQLAASMRPRPDAAENTLIRAALCRGSHASMRPRPDAAENGDTIRWMNSAMMLQ